MPRNSKSALWALAAAGGLWAWRNREKIQGMIKSDKVQSMLNGQRGRSFTQPDTRTYDQTSENQPMTGETRRIDTPETFDQEQRPRYDAAI